MADKIISPFIDIANKELPPLNQGGLSTSQQSQNFFGTMYVGNNKVRIDGQNGRIVINDGTTDRIVIGNL
jgi:hypothetical protein